MIAKCKVLDLIDDLVDTFEVTEITMDSSGIGLVLIDALREKGVKVNEKSRFKMNDNETLEHIATILLIVNRKNMSDKDAIKKIMDVVVKNSSKKLKKYLNEGLKKK